MVSKITDITVDKTEEIDITIIDVTLKLENEQKTPINNPRMADNELNILEKMFIKLLL